jgi:hypothetical protein
MLHGADATQSRQGHPNFLSMTTWHSLVDYLRNNYKIAEEIVDSEKAVSGLKLLFDVGDLRSQFIFVWHHTLRDGHESWVEIVSPFARVADVDLHDVLQAVSGLVCGGLQAVGDTLVLAHSAPLVNLDLNEFDRPFTLVLNSADILEKKFGGGDAF